MHFTKTIFSKKNNPIFSNFFPISPLFQNFSPIFFDDLLNIGLLPPPPKTSDSQKICKNLKTPITQKIGKNRVSDVDRQKQISDS